MIWSDVPQATTRRPQHRKHECTARLHTVRGGTTRLTFSLSPTVLERLGWEAGIGIGLQAGRSAAGAHLVRLYAQQDGRQLRPVPKNETWAMVTLVPSDDLACWNTEQTACDYTVEVGAVIRGGKRAPGALVVTLPWDLSGEPPAVEHEEADAA